MSKQKILVIEDAEGLKEYILAILNKEGFETTGASNGKLGLEMAEEFKPDLVVCDIKMPVLDGYGVLKDMIQNPKLEAVPFIFLTSLDDMQSLRKGMTLGADDYLAKPVHPDHLLKAIATQLQKAATAKQHYLKLHEDENKSIKDRVTKEKLHLSKRQHKILQLVSQGKTTREIADELVISLDAAELIEDIAIRLNKRLYKTDNPDTLEKKVDYELIQEKRLTPRQLEILKLVSRGLTTKEISEELFISVKTVETHRGQIMGRLDMHDLAGLIRHALRIGLISFDD